MNLSPDAIYRAWTQQIDAWFATPETALMRPEINEPFFFLVSHEDQQHPHYGRFLKLEKNKLIELTWLTTGTLGAETWVTVALTPQESRTHVLLTHAGFPNEESMLQHKEAWPKVLEQLERRISKL
ncbi:SRPBCC family protein [Bdellovibrio svalbardensis]|uniref:SRPBCC domain-containing protein n=1 Tax=Bdellovibrio svalbardensis TaxID=2972972 RepID=A0ABT6DFA0_9BACT|nr:SRPBCC domain-containing protein [Bdellovibrio svalbardensis]MDG0815502.1 SRPBCC domain-containing protein [Bdellovibrio svalbardensis]